MFLHAPQQVHGLFPLRLPGRRAYGDKGPPACPALGGQHLSVHSSSLCVSNSPEPCSLGNPAEAAAASLGALGAVGSGCRGSLVPAASGSGWKREGVRGREGPHPLTGHGRAAHAGTTGVRACEAPQPAPLVLVWARL